MCATTALAPSAPISIEFINLIRLKAFAKSNKNIQLNLIEMISFAHTRKFNDIVHGVCAFY